MGPEVERVTAEGREVCARDWIARNSVVFLEKMVEQRRKIGMVLRTVEAKTKLVEQGLSDVGICKVWEDLEKLGMPVGFGLESGGKVVVASQNLLVEHMFVYGEELDQVVCVCPGQFVDRESRVDVSLGYTEGLVLMRSELFVELDSNLGAWAMIAERRILEDVFGFRYLLGSE